MKKIRAIAIFIMIFSIIHITAYASSGPTNTKTIRVGTSGTYYPFTFVEGESLKGFEIDVWNEIGERLGYNIEFKTSAFSGLFGMLDSNKIDVIANQISVTDERKEKYYFSEAYVESGAQLVVKSGQSNTISSLDMVRGKNIGVDLGSNYEKILEEKDTGANIITYQSTDSAFNDLILGRIDGVVIDKISALININDKKLPLELAGETFEKVDNAFAFAKKDENLELVKKVNKTLNDMKDDGTLEELSNKWLNTNVIAKRSNSFFNQLIKTIISGSKVTIMMSLIAIAIGLILGIIIAVIRYLNIKGLRKVVLIYVSFFRGTPLLVQLFLLYFGLPQVFPMLRNMSGFTASYIALGLNASAYISEILRGGFKAIDKGQMEASLSIGMSNIQAVRRIILPQVFRMSIPSIGNIYIDIVKGSSLAFTIGVSEMLAKAQMVAAANYKFFQSYIAVAIMYWIVIEIANFIQGLLERKLSIY